MKPPDSRASRRKPCGGGDAKTSAYAMSARRADGVAATVRDRGPCNFVRRTGNGALWAARVSRVTARRTIWHGKTAATSHEEHGRKFHGIRLRRGRLWLRSRDRNETGLMETGSRLCAYLSMNENV